MLFKFQFFPVLKDPWLIQVEVHHTTFGGKPYCIDHLNYSSWKLCSENTIRKMKTQKFFFITRMKLLSAAYSLTSRRHFQIALWNYWSPSEPVIFVTVKMFHRLVLSEGQQQWDAASSQVFESNLCTMYRHNSGLIFAWKKMSS